MIFLSPLLLSLVLTRAKPEKLLVPPLYIQAITFAEFTAFYWVKYPSDVWPALVFLGVYFYVSGFVLTPIATYLLGVAVKTEDFLSCSFSSGADPEKFRIILATEKFRENLSIVRDTSEDTEEPYRFRGRNGTLNFVGRVTSSPDHHNSLLDLAFFDTTRYYVLPRSDVLKEYANQKTSYLRDILSRSGFNLDERSSESAETLVHLTMSRMQGVVPLLGNLSRLGWLKVFAFLGAMVWLAFDALVLKDITTSAGLIVLILVTVAFELRSVKTTSRYG